MKGRIFPLTGNLNYFHKVMNIKFLDENQFLMNIFNKIHKAF